MANILTRFINKMASAIAVATASILENHSFGGGTYAPPLPISGALPKNWVLDWWYRDIDPVLGTGTTWQAPELIALEWGKQFPERQFLYGDNPSDDFALKGFHGSAAVGFGFKQTIVNAPAWRYRFDVPVFPDQWHRVPMAQWDAIRAANPNHPNRFDADPGYWQVRPSPHTSDDFYLASEVYASCQSGNGAVNDTGWNDARTVPIGVYTVLTVIHDHPGGDLTLRFGARGRWPFDQNGWWWDELSLVQVGPSTPPAPPTEDPRIAIARQYADQFETLAGNLKREMQ